MSSRPIIIDGDRHEPHEQSPHPGETVRFECIQAAGLTVTEAARRLGCSRPALLRVAENTTSLRSKRQLEQIRVRSRESVTYSGYSGFPIAESRYSRAIRAGR